MECKVETSESCSAADSLFNRDIVECKVDSATGAVRSLMRI